MPEFRGREKAEDPICILVPSCGHRHKAKEPCWYVDDGGESCVHASRCKFCRSVIVHDDGHLVVEDGSFIHDVCLKHVPPEDRVPMQSR